MTSIQQSDPLTQTWITTVKPWGCIWGQRHTTCCLRVGLYVYTLVQLSTCRVICDTLVQLVSCYIWGHTNCIVAPMYTIRFTLHCTLMTVELNTVNCTPVPYYTVHMYTDCTLYTVRLGSCVYTCRRLGSHIQSWTQDLYSSVQLSIGQCNA